MLKSMTGYGVSVNEKTGYTIKTEIKSLNSRYFEIKMKLPLNISKKEPELRNYLENKLLRGKIELTIHFRYSDSQKTRKFLKKDVMKDYMLEIHEFCDEMNLKRPDTIDTVLNLPEVISSDLLDNQDEETEWNDIMKSVSDAVLNFDHSRSEEGGRLEKEIMTYISKIESLEKEINQEKEERISKIRDKISARLSELKTSEINYERFEQEMIYYIEKLDFTEEIDRLTSHLDYFRKTTAEPDNGRKLGFIIQEMGREINTIGSKANDFQIQQKVVMMKNELEKIRQQLANIL